MSTGVNIHPSIGQPVRTPKEECGCEFHAIIHPASEVYPPCMYADTESLAVDSKGRNGNWVKKPIEPDKEVVMEDGGFFIEKVPEFNNFDQHDSYIMHFCPTEYWKVYVEETYMQEHGVCNHCLETIPPGLIALWKMHNWSYLQNSQGVVVDPYQGADWSMQEGDACV